MSACRRSEGMRGKLIPEAKTQHGLSQATLFTKLHSYARATPELRNYSLDRASLDRGSCPIPCPFAERNSQYASFSPSTPLLFAFGTDELCVYRRSSGRANRSTAWYAGRAHPRWRPITHLHSRTRAKSIHATRRRSAGHRCHRSCLFTFRKKDSRI